MSFIWRKYTDGEDRVKVQVEYLLTRDELACALLTDIGGLVEWCDCTEQDERHLVVSEFDHVNHTTRQRHSLTKKEVEQRIRDQLWRSRDQLDYWNDNYGSNYGDTPDADAAWEWAVRMVKDL